MDTRPKIAPKISDRISSLTPARRELLEKILKEKGLKYLSSQAIPRRHQDYAPLSFAQETFWFTDQFDKDHSNHCRPQAFRMRGRLDAGALAQSLNEIVRRHEILRTTFVVKDGDPLQVIHPHSPLKLAREDLRTWPAVKRDNAAVQLISQEMRRPFDLTLGPLLRLTLYRLDEEDHILLAAMHHIVVDGWSAGIFAQEFSSLYDIFSEGGHPELPELPIQYADYSGWQREKFEGEGLRVLLPYWKKQLGDAPALLNLPFDRPRPPVRTYRGATHSLALSGGLREGLEELGRNEESTLFMTLLAAFKTLLFRYTGQEDMVVGVPVAGRTRVEVENLIGFFINTLVLRSDLSGDPTFRELLRRVRKTALDAYAHQDLPVEKLVEELRPERSLSYPALFQVMFGLEKMPKKLPAMHNLRIEEVPLDTGAVQVDLALDVYEKEDGLLCVFKYSIDLFDAETIQRMAGHFRTLLEGIAAEPRRRLSGLSLLSEAERNQILIQWNDTKKEYSLNYCIHQLFEAQAAKTPEAVAAVYEDRKLIYRELNAKANGLALLLIKKGIGKGSYVPVLIEKSLDLLISCLAIMKSGAAFCPVDVNWPLERIREILAELKSRIVLVDTASSHRKAFPDLELFTVSEQELPGSVLNPDVTVSPGDPIYVIFTSGSTGRPKGAINRHCGIANRFFNTTERYGSRDDDAVLVTSSHVFDASVWQLFWPLTNGARAVIPRGNPFFDLEYYIGLIEKERVTLTDMVPSLFSVLVEYLAHNRGAREKMHSMRQLLIGGEAMDADVVYKFKSLLPGTGVTNTYGPAETSIDVLFYEVPDTYMNPVPIGRPLHNVHSFILDTNLTPLPVGVTGELYIGGVCVGLGYLNDDNATRAAFIENPFKEVDCPVLYRTGDLARYLPDGNIQFLGRSDTQIKIRGIRIELAEIEGVLSLHPEVREAVVVPKENRRGEKNLTAYLVLRDERTVGPADLRDFVRKQLPSVMVPAAFVFLDAFPLTAVGKRDMRAITEPDDAYRGRTRTYNAPRSRTEELVAEVWAEVLGVTKIDIHDNFFEMGGHSLAAARIISRLYDRLTLILPVRSIFEMPTVSGLSHIIEAMQAGSPDLCNAESAESNRHEEGIV